MVCKTSYEYQVRSVPSWMDGWGMEEALLLLHNDAAQSIAEVSQIFKYETLGRVIVKAVTTSVIELREQM